MVMRLFYKPGDIRRFGQPTVDYPLTISGLLPTKNDQISDTFKKTKINILSVFEKSISHNNLAYSTDVYVGYSPTRPNCWL
jgi:hypothetical protein